MDIEKIEEIMIQHGIVIRAIPYTNTGVYDIRHVNKYPHGKTYCDERLDVN